MDISSAVLINHEMLNKNIEMDIKHFTHITNFLRYPTRVLLTSAPVSREKVKIVCQEYREYLGFFYKIFPKTFWFFMNYQTKGDKKSKYLRHCVLISVPQEFVWGVR